MKQSRLPLVDMNACDYYSALLYTTVKAHSCATMHSGPSYWQCSSTLCVRWTTRIAKTIEEKGDYKLFNLLFWFFHTLLNCNKLVSRVKILLKKKIKHHSYVYKFPWPKNGQSFRQRNHLLSFTLCNPPPPPTHTNHMRVSHFRLTPVTNTFMGTWWHKKNHH